MVATVLLDIVLGAAVEVFRECTRPSDIGGSSGAVVIVVGGGVAGSSTRRRNRSRSCSSTVVVVVVVVVVVGSWPLSSSWSQQLSSSSLWLWSWFRCRCCGRRRRRILVSFRTIAVVSYCTAPRSTVLCHMHASYGTACIVLPSHCAPGRDDFDFFCFNLTGVPLWSFRLNHRLLCDWRGIHCRKHILKTTRPTRGPELTERKPLLDLTLSLPCASILSSRLLG